MSRRAVLDDELVYVKRSLMISFYLTGILSILFAPFVFIFIIFKFILQHGYSMYSSPEDLSIRSYIPSIKWKFRAYNELVHYFDERINKSLEYSHSFISSSLFPKNIYLNILTKFILFISSSIAILIIILGIFNEHFLFNYTIPSIAVFRDKNPLWWLTFLGIVILGCNKILFEAPPISEETVNDIINQIHTLLFNYSLYNRISINMTEIVHIKTRLLYYYKYKHVILFFELCGILFTPFIFLIHLPGKINCIINFIRDNTVYLHDVGYVCSFSTFSQNNVTKKQNDSIEYFKNTFGYESNVEFSNEQLGMYLSVCDFN
jgi:hypothetical protein